MREALGDSGLACEMFAKGDRGGRFEVGDALVHFRCFRCESAESRLGRGLDKP
jgi:hypothetical protein